MKWISALALMVSLGAMTIALADHHQKSHNTLTKKEKDAGWKLLFDGETTDGWRGYRKEKLPDA